jgi:hypothetical protein
VTYPIHRTTILGRRVLINDGWHQARQKAAVQKT